MSWLKVNEQVNMSPLATQLEAYFASNKELAKLSAVPTQIKPFEYLHRKFVTTLLLQIQWSSHLHILNKTKTPEEKLFYLLLALKEKLSVREIERQLNSAVYERSLMGNKIVSSLMTQLPSGINTVYQKLREKKYGLLQN